MCEYEDSTWCFWIASLQGNGKGKSFITLWEGMTIDMVTGLTILALVIAVVVLLWLHVSGKLTHRDDSITANPYESELMIKASEAINETLVDELQTIKLWTVGGFSRTYLVDGWLYLVRFDDNDDVYLVNELGPIADRSEA